jgi:hypothetical protein
LINYLLVFHTTNAQLLEKTFHFSCDKWNERFYCFMVFEIFQFFFLSTKLSQFLEQKVEMGTMKACK